MSLRPASVASPQEVAKHRADDWAKENEEVIRSANEYVAKRGLPLAKYRRF
jgi:post-segregation antitoxin (ccd killing protein)